MIICADMHIGKAAHFRNNGIPLPHLVNKNNFWNLSLAFEIYKPDCLLVLGDMVHSTKNNEWQDFTDFLDNYPNIARRLVRGNHELYADKTYTELGFEVTTQLQLADLLFTHEPLDEVPEGSCNVFGHIHPAISLSGMARQHLRFPCFHLCKNQFNLPAFGEFTGMHSIRPCSGDRVFAVVENGVIKLGNR